MSLNPLHNPLQPTIVPLPSSRQLAFLALRSVHRGAYADVALDKVLHSAELSLNDRRLVTELVYGSVRRQRTLDALIDHLAKKSSHQQPLDLRAILHLGLYQLCYLDQIPASAAVNTTVDLAKQNGFVGLAGFVNGLLRQLIRLANPQDNSSALPEPPSEPDTQNSKLKTLLTAATPIAQLGIFHSYPDWIIEVWAEQIGLAETEQLCEWMNRSPHIDLRVNPLRASLETVETAMQAAGIAVRRVSPLPQALRLLQPGAIQHLPGFAEGWWMVQDSSAQLVAQLVDPQPGEFVVDACAAPGGKTLHLAELMHDRGTIWACDRTPSRLKKLQQNVDRLGLTSIQSCMGDSRALPQFVGQCDRVLIDAPCSGLGTLHRHADARWRQTAESVAELATLQAELLNQAATWTKPDGTIVYATCTLHPAENEQQIQAFLTRHPDWQIDRPVDALLSAFALPEGWLKVWPQHRDMDGFFMVRLCRNGAIGCRV